MDIFDVLGPLISMLLLFGVLFVFYMIVAAYARSRRVGQLADRLERLEHREYRSLKRELEAVARRQSILEEMVAELRRAPVKEAPPLEVAPVPILPAIHERERMEEAAPAPHAARLEPRPVPVPMPAPAAAAPPPQMPPWIPERPAAGVIPKPELRPAAAAGAAREPARPAIAAKPAAAAASDATGHPKLTGQEFELLVGGSWLNKIGVLVLVVGISLLIGWSVAHLGALGRILIGLAAGSTMLWTGFVLERRMPYQIFARGLMAGGWAALYFTTYAMHAIEAARVIEDPLLGILLLAAVAAGMIVHSLRYRLEVVTALAYGIGYVTLLISPNSVFTAIACIPLTLSLVIVAWRFRWSAMLVAGVICTYATFSLRYDPEFGSRAVLPGLSVAQLILATYWLMFEVIDIGLVIRGREQIEIGRTIFPLNASGFIGVSLLEWPATASTEALALFFAVTAAGYFASTLARALLRPPARFPQATTPVHRAVLGGYECAVTLTAALALVAIFLKFHGLKLNIALLIEGEFLFLAGVFLGQVYLRGLGAAVCCLPFVKLIAADMPAGGETDFAGLTLRRSTPTAFFTAGVYYVNRALIQRAKELTFRTGELLYGYAGSAILAAVIFYEMSETHRGAAWLGLGLVLFEVGYRLKLIDFRAQAYVIAGAGLYTLETLNGLMLPGNAVASEATTGLWGWLIPAVVAAYVTTFRLFRAERDRFGDAELLAAREASLAAGTILLGTVLWHALPAPLVALGWGVSGLLLVELGLVASRRAVRLNGNILVLLAVGRLFFVNFTTPGTTLGVSHRLLTVVPIVVLLWHLRARFKESLEGALPASWERALVRLYLYIPTILLVVLLRFELGRVLAVSGWAILMVNLLALGIRQKNEDLRWQSYLVAILTFARSWATNFNMPESLTGAFGRAETGALVIGCLYLAGFLSPRSAEPLRAAAAGGLTWGLNWFDHHARRVFPVLADVLLTVLVWYEVSGKLLTAGWAIEGTVLLLVGVLAGESVFRRSGLVLLLLCTLKVFAYDLRELEMPYRILSFILLGLLLIAVSWIYTRFRDSMRRYI
ncbi:MAG: DUF2339 domain-containing protein [Deltaproteobacteria bacterium]